CVSASSSCRRRSRYCPGFPSRRPRGASCATPPTRGCCRGRPRSPVTILGQSRDDLSARRVRAKPERHKKNQLCPRPGPPTTLHSAAISARPDVGPDMGRAEQFFLVGLPGPCPEGGILKEAFGTAGEPCWLTQLANSSVPSSSAPRRRLIMSSA